MEKCVKMCFHTLTGITEKNLNLFTCTFAAFSRWIQYLWINILIHIVRLFHRIFAVCANSSTQTSSDNKYLAKVNMSKIRCQMQIFDRKVEIMDMFMVNANPLTKIPFNHWLFTINPLHIFLVTHDLYYNISWSRCRYGIIIKGFMILRQNCQRKHLE